MLDIKGVLLDPNDFFRKKTNEKVSLKEPFFIVLINSIIAVISSMLVMKKVMTMLPSEISTYMVPGLAVGTIVGIIASFSFWLIFSGIIYVISSRFNSSGSFKRTIEFVGYGYIPKAFAAFIGLLVLYLILPSIDVSTQNSQLMQQSIDQLISHNPLLWIYQFVGILCALWSANIWIFATSYARKISVKNAFFSLLIPVGLALVYSTYNLVNSIT
ncbi:Yip1 domain protein (plasmid) [Methanomethylovorans hollandica DSM 15978]|uniref:Yip1 domain protein n=1 Tax=Methanomethylovorans hollandica (strain DSM 15978 / NBRC 107637 / DMS1) TaxID=867904 RepID=L0L2Q5_METHD|nr:YIP1 family protein [Methanomethylovorans hollandica]AGB50698.1 Yip1 domain protein [Methanomethylovorans hollandica DSM 15978]